MPIASDPKAAKSAAAKPVPAPIVDRSRRSGGGRPGPDRAAIEALAVGESTFLPIAPSPTKSVARIRILCAADNLRKRLPHLKIKTACLGEAQQITVTRVA